MDRFEDAAVNDHVIFFAAILADVFADTVEHHDGVLHRVTDNRQHSGHKQRVSFPLEQDAQNGHDAHRDQDVVEHSRDSTGTITEGVRDLAERPDDEEQDDPGDSQRCQDGGLGYLFTYCRGYAAAGDRAFGLVRVGSPESTKLFLQADLEIFDIG